jgi:hypothetical protein
VGPVGTPYTAWMTDGALALVFLFEVHCMFSFDPAEWQTLLLP